MSEKQYNLRSFVRDESPCFGLSNIAEHMHSEGMDTVELALYKKPTDGF